jgi:prevent-host-death family protein
MKTITKEEAASGFAGVMAKVTAGEEVVITDNGAPVAKIVPLNRRPATTPERKVAIERMMKFLRESDLHLGGKGFSRDEMHER